MVAPFTAESTRNYKKDPTLNTLLPLIAIPSLGGTPGEVSAQEFMAQSLKDLDLEVHTWEINIDQLSRQPDFPGMEVPRTRALGVLGIWRGSGDLPALMINGHTDVVPPGDLDSWDRDPFDPHVATRDLTDHVVIGRGACDMKGGLASALTALRTLKASGFTPRGDILFAPVVGEEDGGLGTYALIREGLPTFYGDFNGDFNGDAPIAGAVIPEPTSLAIIPANAGALTFRVLVRGSATHASRRSEGISAIEKFFPILNSLRELESQRNENPDPLMARWDIAYPLSIGTVHSGDWASTVPDLLIAEGRYGVALGEDVLSAKLTLESAVAAACNSDPWLREHPVEVQWWGGQFASGRTDPNADIVRNAKAAHTCVLGHEPDTYAAPYGSDLRLLTGLASIPTIQYGPGDASVAHAPNEYVSIEQLHVTSRVIASLIERTLG